MGYYMKKLSLLMSIGLSFSPLLCANDAQQQNVASQAERISDNKSDAKLWLIPAAPLIFQAVMVSAICAVQPEARTYFLSMLNNKNYLGLLNSLACGYLYSVSTLTGVGGILVGIGFDDPELSMFSDMVTFFSGMGWCSAFGSRFWQPDSVKVDNSTPDWMYIAS
jgi:hypothetical protein